MQYQGPILVLMNKWQIFVFLGSLSVCVCVLPLCGQALSYSTTNRNPERSWHTL